MVAAINLREPILAPVAERPAIREVSTILSARSPIEGQAHLVGPGGTSTPLPPALYEILTRAAADLAAGRGVVILPYGAELTTQQAADLLNVSRPTLINLLEDGAIAYSRVRTHRRIQLSDLLAFQQVRRAQTERAHQRVVDRAQELGVYDDYAPVARDDSDAEVNAR